MKTAWIIPFVGGLLAIGCSNNAQSDTDKAAKSAATSLEDMAKTIKAVSKTADQVQRISSRIRNIKGVEMSHSHDKWEYKLVSVTSNAGISEDDLNDYGKEGWELTTRQGDTLIFKRRKVLTVSDKQGESPEDK